MQRYGFSHRFEKQFLLGMDLVRPRERPLGNQGIAETWNAELE